MKVFVVYAHPEPRSFGASLLDVARRTLAEAGHQVVVTDLYAMGFNPIASAADFRERRFPDELHYDREQKYACERSGFSSDIQTEIEKLLWCNLLILQFPLWWFSVPAIMKGWIDRVFVNGVAYGKGRRLDCGGLAGRKGMLALTTACYAEMAAPDGLLADININLWHLNAGTLGYAGLQVLPPFVGWSIQYSTAEQRSAYLEQYAERLRAIETTPPMPFHGLADFGPDWRLRAEIEPRTIAHRRPAPI
jgi:NAD(P)H dehydrogenase (quinone)